MTQALCTICGCYHSKRLRRTVIAHYLRAAWLAVRIVEYPWQDNGDRSMSLIAAWSVARGMWLEK